MFAEIVVNMPVEGTFHYYIPPDLAGRLEIGHLVEVPFGKQKAQGIVLRFDLRSPVGKTRPIERLIDRQPVINEKHLALAQWMSDTYLSPLSDCLRLFIPPGLGKRGDTLITPLIAPDLIEAATDNQRRVLNLLERRGPLRGRQIAHSMPRRDWQGAVSQLAGRGLLLREPVLDPPSVKEKQARVVDLAIPPERVEEAVARHLNPDGLPANRKAAAQRRAAILRLLAREGGSLQASLIYAVVAGSDLNDLRVLLDDDLIALREEEVWRDSLQGVTFVPDRLPQLTPDQARVWEYVQATLDAPGEHRPILLHGVTGSGKTEIYLRAVEHVLDQGRTAIVLVPEIALTPQTIRRFGARFAGRMGLIHSELSTGERYDTWRRARNRQIDLVIGPRSALFAPLPDIGLIVLDECHDDSYKQVEPLVSLPPYHAVPTAVELARLHGGLAILGSATPDVITYAHASRPGEEPEKQYVLLELPARIMGHRQAIESQAVHYRIGHTRYTHLPDDPDEAVMIDLPPVKVVDMRQELRANNRSIFSRALSAELQTTLDRGEQAILFLNRRGTATHVFCRACGYVYLCRECDIPMTWHTLRREEADQEGFLVCHACNRREEHPMACPACGSNQIKFFGGGTQRVEQAVREQFPGASTLRWDRDTTGGKEAHAALLEHFIRREANVLIGTQMVAKGLDLPLVTLVGVVSADTALHLPDYRCGERTFQLLTQVAGRAGRGLLGGQVIVQTYHPEHYAIQAASRHDFHTFYEREIRYRGELRYPPYSRLIRLVILEGTLDGARERAQDLHYLLSGRIAERGLEDHTALIGPAPCFYPRRGGYYRWQVIVRGPEPAAILHDIRPSRGLHIDVDPVSLL